MFQFLMHSKSAEESSSVYQKLQKLVVMMMEFKKENYEDNVNLIGFIDKFKKITKDYLKEDPRKTYEAKMIIRRNYNSFD